MNLPAPESPHAHAAARSVPTIFPIPAFNDNYIWLIIDTLSRNAIVVDPGQAAPVIEVLKARSLRVSAILLTHHHADHVGGVDGLLAYAACTLDAEQPPDLAGGGIHGIPVYGPAGESISQVTVPLSEGDIVDIASPRAQFTVIDVPGHTRGHIAYFQPSFVAADQADRAVALTDCAEVPRLFCGDTLFASGCGRLFEGTPAQMLASLDKLAALPPDTHVYCAHEYTLSNIRFALAVDEHNEALLAWRDRATELRREGVPTIPTTIAEERRVNPFLRVEDPAILARLGEETRVGAPSFQPDRLSVFTALRAWKDRF